MKILVDCCLYSSSYYCRAMYISLDPPPESPIIKTGGDIYGSICGAPSRPRFEKVDQQAKIIEDSPIP